MGQRLSNIRVNALEAANSATKARKRMETRRKNNLIRYDLQDAKRDVIREMIWEKPEKNWILKENFNEKLNMQLMDDCLDNVDDEYMKTMYPGLPQVGCYDTMEGLYRHSDKYFDIENENNLLHIKEEQTVTSVTKQPVSWYVRKNDSKDEFVEEIYESQMRLNKHLKRITQNSQWKAKKAGKQSVNEGKQQDIEYEVDDKNIVPNYWLNIDWDKALSKEQSTRIIWISRPFSLVPR